MSSLAPSSADTVSVTGARKIDFILGQMRTTGARRAISLGSRKSMQELAKLVKKAVPSKYKEARKNVGYRAFKVNEAPGGGAMAGGQVGKQTKARRRLKDRAGRKGVGVGRGLQWLMHGTAPRKTGKGGGAVRKTGKFAKVMPTTRQIADKNKARLLMVLRKHTWIGIQKEIKKGKAFA